MSKYSIKGKKKSIMLRCAIDYIKRAGGIMKKMFNILFRKNVKSVKFIVW